MKKQETGHAAAAQEKQAFNQIAYQNNFNREKYDHFHLIMQKGKKERVKIAAMAAGQSTNEYINAAIGRALDDGAREQL